MMGFMKPPVKGIKELLVEFHRKRDYKIFGSFPLISKDPTVMFVNATITPFKLWFVDDCINPENYPLIQGCLRVGGAAELDVMGVNPA
jgi:alanyl-tRNA synthetase